MACLTGCFHHNYRARPYTLCQTDLGENVQAAFNTGVVTSGSLDEAPWWDFFQDEQLSRFIELSLACYPDMHIADARIRLACQEARIARSALFPHLFGVGSLQRQKISELGPGFVPGFPDLFTETTLELTTAVYELDIWQKNRSQYYAMLDLMQAARADYQEAALLLSTTIASIYFDVQMKLARLEVTQKRLAAREELYGLYKQQFDLGIISEFRLYEVDSEVQLLRDLIYVLDAEIAIDKHALTALGCGCHALELAPSAQFNTPFPLPTTLPIDLLARRPDVTAQKWRIEASCMAIKVAQANFFPRIDLLGWAGFQSIKIDKLFRGETLIGLGAGAATLPLFLAGKLQAELGATREELEMAIEAYNLTILKAVQQVSDALSDLEAAEARQIAVKQAIADASSLLDLTQQKFTQGIANKLTVLGAVENQLVQQDIGIQVQLARFQAAVDLIQAIGGGYYDCGP